MYNNCSIIAVIPARSGSVGVKDKNIRSFVGHPLYLWSVSAALESKLIDSIVISSDYDDLFVPQNVQLIKRPAELCTSDSTTESCLLHVLDNMVNNFDSVVTLQPTSPIRRRGFIDNLIRKMHDDKKDSALTVESITPFLLKKQDDSIQWYFNPLERKMRQDLETDDMYLHDDGSVYVSKVRSLRRNNCRLTLTPSIVINDELSSYQIDTEFDFVLLETTWKLIANKDDYVQPTDSTNS